ncbi:MAG: nucleotidyltransferase domain-containing protein [Candidatus Hydrothermarchaeota archaeon]|nr:MAG: nucleotidyltransferase domain-containing protein [Candidatus Hydrothermarchaeota archaeon]
MNSMEKVIIKSEIKKILKTMPNILFAYIHGSFLKEKFRDIDVAIYLDKEYEYDKKTILKKELELEEILGRKIKYPVDVRVLNNSPLSFRFNVIRYGEILFSKNEDVRSDFEALTISEYHDFAYFRRVYMKEALNLEV